MPDISKPKKRLFSRSKSMLGAALAEVAILILCIAIAGKVAIGYLGEKTKQRFCAAGNAVGGGGG